MREPFYLDLTHALAHLAGGPDKWLTEILKGGAPLGVEEHFEVPPGVLWDKIVDDFDSGAQLESCANYESAYKYEEQLRAQFDEDVEEGLAAGPFHDDDDALANCLGVGVGELCHGSLAVIQEGSDK